MFDLQKKLDSAINSSSSCVVDSLARGAASGDLDRAENRNGIPNAEKLASHPKQNGLARALREIGRIERTLFMLDWFRDPALRRRVQAGLNKGEARNALARAVFMHRLGEVRD